MLGHPLRVRVRIRELFQDGFLTGVHLELIHPGDRRIVLVPIDCLALVDALLDVALLVRIDVHRGQLHKSFEELALLGQFHQLERAGHIDADGLVDAALEVDLGGTVDDDVQVLPDLLPQLLLQIQVSLRLWKQKAPSWSTTSSFWGHVNKTHLPGLTGWGQASTW